MAEVGFGGKWAWGGWRLGLVPAFLLLVATAEVIHMRHDFFQAWGPLLGVGWYLVLLVMVNSSRVEVGREGVRFSYGPLPSGARDRYFPVSEISRVFVREYADLSRYGGYYKAVGIETRSGFAFEFEREELPAATIGARAEALARALGWQGGVVAIAGPLPGRGLQGWREWAPVLVALAGGGCWVLWVFGGIR